MASTSAQPGALFVREGDDFEYQSGTAGQGFRTTVYCHHENNMRVVLCRVPNPMCRLTICVPTIATDNKGLPHTLEHLVFCGSERYPNHGSLDTIAGCNFSYGTRGCTNADHTFYTVTTAGEEAIANLLPVFLDHVLHPLLSDDQFITEVYYFDASGKERGVVFSEMVMHENGRVDLTRVALYKLVYSEKSPYSFHAGGHTKDIATLTNQEIIDYHRKFYDANNITVLLVGSFSDSFESVLQQLPADLVTSGGCDSRKPIECPEPVGDRRSEYIRFPSASADTGAFKFGWRGPMPDDAVAITALEILLRYLTKGASSPLRQRFIECAVPLSSSLYAYIGIGALSPAIMTFDGIPYIDSRNTCADSEIPMLFSEGYFESLLIKELQRLYDSKFDGNAGALSQAAKEYRQSFAMELESSPLQKLETVLIRDVTASHWSSSSEFRVGTYARVFDIIDELIQKPVDFWLDLLKRFIDTGVYSVAAVPDTELGKKLEQERRDIEQRNAQSISDKDRHTRRIERAVEASKLSIPDELKRSIHIPDAQKIASLPHVHEIVELATPIGPAAVVQLIELETAFPTLTLSIPLPDLPDNLRPYLALFWDLILATDLAIPPGVAYDGDISDTARCVSRIEFDRQLAATTVSKWAYIVPNTDIFYVYLKSTHENVGVASHLLVLALLFADFTTERTLAAAQKLLNNIANRKLLSESMLDEITWHFSAQDCTNRSRWVSNQMSAFEHERFLQGVIKSLGSGDTKIVDRLSELQRYIANRTGGFLTFTSSSGQREKNMRFIDNLAQDWQDCFGWFSEQAGGDASSHGGGLPAYPFPCLRHSRFLNVPHPLNIQVIMSTLQAAVVRICCESCAFTPPTPDRPFDEQLADLPGIDYYALEVLISVLQRSGGPLYNAIRSKGLGYTPSLRQDMWSDMLVFEVDQTPDASMAILEILEFVSGVGEHWDKYVTHFEITMAKSEMVCRSASLQCSPYWLTDYCISSNLLGFASASQYTVWRRAHISAVKSADLRRVYDLYLKRFVTPRHPLLTVVLTPSDTELSAELTKFEIKTLDEL